MIGIIDYAYHGRIALAEIQVADTFGGKGGPQVPSLMDVSVATIIPMASISPPNKREKGGQPFD